MENSVPNEELLINITPQETRVAVVENGVLQELYLERKTKRGLVGNIYHGKVSRVLPSMQAAFVDIGLDKAAFLHVSDLLLTEEEKALPAARYSDFPDITKLIHQNQQLVVQVMKDPIGNKGARLTAQITLPSRYLVLLPETQHIGVSQRIEDVAERERLKSLVTPISQKMGVGFILRTAAENVREKSLTTDAEYLERLWNKVNERRGYAKPGDLLYEELDLATRAIRDLVHPGVDKILIDSKENHHRVKKFVGNLVPGISSKLEYYSGERPLFDLYNIDEEIQKALERTVQLKSGGHIVIDQTEAMTTIDVNTGGFVGNNNQEETIFKTNLEAAVTLARQLRLRNLGGIIIIDFIDMHDEEHKRQVLRILEKAINKDHTKYNISNVSGLGLVQMSRHRTRESLEHILCEPCPMCQNRGSVKTTETICYEILREILRAARAYEAQQIMVIASQNVVERLLDEEADSVAELEEFIKKTISFQVEILYFQEQYDVVPV